MQVVDYGQRQHSFSNYEPMKMSNPKEIETLQKVELAREISIEKLKKLEKEKTEKLNTEKNRIE